MTSSLLAVLARTKSKEDAMNMVLSQRDPAVAGVRRGPSQPSPRDLASQTVAL
jgi:hypothetical protein